MQRRGDDVVNSAARRRALAIVVAGAVWCVGLAAVGWAGMDTLPMLPAAGVAVVAAGFAAARLGWPASLVVMWAATVAAAVAWLWGWTDAGVAALASVMVGTLCWAFWATSAAALAAALRLSRGESASLWAR
ncbi:hypothetical protein G7070_02525 [Propioniciclava coleopterorum]|uniref:Uncharacterized protein n=1 Tax=Propioniciclava coleopterorum TaxID=2714937 RepID=A0A6G7Y3A5_9ACTN|nr:hypothetical protein [Propioniciclava coleopterorum]QIK71364.1 hypothetical protein G7070_02525 [Propioniciclava coleopterorum]